MCGCVGLKVMWGYVMYVKSEIKLGKVRDIRKGYLRESKVVFG
jgi:hypothetical protein